MGTIVWVLGFLWGLSGAVAAFASGKPGLWRLTIWLGPLAFFLFPGDGGLEFSCNRMMRGACNRSLERLAAEFGHGPATGTLAIALGHACYPHAKYGDNGFSDMVVGQLKEFSAKPCDARTACGHVEQWLDIGVLSTTGVFQRVWGLDPEQFLERFFEEFASTQSAPERIDHKIKTVDLVQPISETVIVDRAETPAREGDLDALGSVGNAPPSVDVVQPASRATWRFALVGVAMFAIGIVIGLYFNHKTEHVESLREWKDNTGTFEAQASLVSQFDGHVFLKKSNGNVVKVPIRRLSECDRQYVFTVLSPGAGQPVTTDSAGDW